MKSAGSLVVRGSAEEILRQRAATLARPAVRSATDGAVIEVATFRLGREIYAIEARYVREVMRLVDYTPVPGIPEFFVGVTNLRGEILAIVDLARFLGIERSGITDLSRLVVLGEEAAELGVLGDETREVVTIATDEIHPPPAALATQARSCVRGMTSEALVVLDGKALLADHRLRCDDDRTGTV